MTTLIGEKYIKLENGSVEGEFYLSDNTTTKFNIEKNGIWEQWENSTNNLCLSVSRLEKLTEKLIFEGRDLK